MCLGIKNMEVIEFINRRWKKDANWLNGNCYYFALILKDRFPKGRIWYDVIYGHFIFELKGRFYDFSGEIAVPGGAYCIPWDEMEAYDKLLYKRIIRDCIL